MNIFDIYLEKIIKILEIVKKNKTITVPENLNGVKVDIPPAQFDCDISTNVAMILAKPNNEAPKNIASKLIDYIKKDDDNIENITVESPGFINIKFKSSFWNIFLKDIIYDSKNFGVNKNSKKKNIL